MANMHYNTIVFSESKFESKEDIFKAVAKQLELLLNAGYVAVVRYDEPGLGIVVIEYDHDNTFDDWGGYNPIWISAEEEERITITREKLYEN